MLEKLKKYPLVGQFVRYLFTGGLAFIVDFGLFALFLYVVEIHYLLANLAGLIGGLVLNYIMSVAWVFADCTRKMERKKGAEFLVFTLVGIAGVGINQLLMFIMVGQLTINEMVSKVVAAGIVLMWNFLARKLLLFKSKS